MKGFNGAETDVELFCKLLNIEESPSNAWGEVKG